MSSSDLDKVLIPRSYLNIIDQLAEDVRRLKRGRPLRVDRLDQISPVVGNLREATLWIVNPNTGAVRGIVTGNPNDDSGNYHMVFFNENREITVSVNADTGALEAGAQSVRLDQDGIAVLDAGDAIQLYDSSYKEYGYLSFKTYPDAGTSRLEMRVYQVASETNVINNGDFETGDLTSWTVTDPTSKFSVVSTDKGKSLKVAQGATSSNFLTQNLVGGGNQYGMVITMKVKGGGDVAAGTVAAPELQSLPENTGWRNLIFIVSGTVTNFKMYFNSAANDLYVDDIKVRSLSISPDSAQLLMSPFLGTQILGRMSTSVFDVYPQKDGNLASGVYLANALYMSSDVTENVSGTYNDYTSTSMRSLACLKLNTTGATILNGLDFYYQDGFYNLNSTFKGRILMLRNVGSYNLTLAHENAGSRATYRFNLDGSDLVIPAGRSVLLRYSGTRWEVVSTFGGSGGVGSTSFVTNETPSGTVNGTNTVFTFANAFVAGSLMLFRDGQLMKGGGNDYTETNPATGTVTFTTAPVTGSVLLGSYQQSVSTTGNADTLDGYHASSFAQQSEWRSGWLPVTETWTYASADDPVYQIYVSGDVTANADYKLGNKIKCTNNSTTFQGWIVKVGAYDAGNNRTPVDIYGGSDYDLANSAITLPYISKVKSPDGFPLDRSKWDREVTDTAQRTQPTPNQYQIYNIQSLSMVVPIGLWDLGFEAEVGVTLNAAPASGGFAAGLSTANNSLLAAYKEVWLFPNANGNFTYRKKFFRLVPTSLTTKTTYYLNETCNWAGAASLDVYGNSMTTKIIAKFLYL